MNDIQTIEEARAFLFELENWKKGNHCPCCDQLVKLYSRKINMVMAKTLISLYKISFDNEDYHHVSDFMVHNVGTNDFSKLRYWGLIVEQEKDETDTHKRTSGFWAITKKGRSFVRGEVLVPMYADTFNMESKRLSGEFVSIRQALGVRFDYAELMGDYLPKDTNNGQMELV